MTPRHACIISVLIGVGVGVSSCILVPNDQVISGRLTSDFGCYLLWDDGTYQLHRWEDPIPPLGSYVSLRVKPMPGHASTCQAGEMVDVLEVVNVHTDFRTANVVGEETWGPEDEIVLGQVEVVPGAALAVLPGTIIRIIREGHLHVRGRITMEGLPSDSVRIEGIESPRGRLSPGPVVLDSVASDSRVRFVTTRTQFEIHGDAPMIESIQGWVSVNQGSATIRDSYLHGVSGHAASIVIEQCNAEYIDGVRTSFTLKGNELSRLSLSYSTATASGNVFGRDVSNVLFHGTSGGKFEHNTFNADSTRIEVRHDSDPVFQRNNFVSRGMAVECNGHYGSCIQLANNWWGTTDEAAIRSRLHGQCYYCYSPWLMGPVP
jgi:hypothetical protein